MVYQILEIKALILELKGIEPYKEIWSFFTENQSVFNPFNSLYL
jgi:hypothetical protein